MKKTFNDLVLQLQLGQFGLNPKDWTLKKVGPSKYHICHRKDLETCFQGIVKRQANHVSWQEIQVAL